MSSTQENVFVTGATGNIGSEVVRNLVKKGINATAYVRDENKANDLFKNELNTDYLKIVVGTYTTIDVFTEAIQGHTRLFLLFSASTAKPIEMSQVKGTLAKIAFEQGVRQIVDLSSAYVTSYGKRGIIGYAHTTAEEKLWPLADEDFEQRSLVIIRPGAFMSNHFHYDVHQVKKANKLVSCAAPSMKTTWIDTRGKIKEHLPFILSVFLLLIDIAACAVAVLSESIEKHDRNVYEMGAQALTNEQRATIFSKVLGRRIVYEQQSFENFYKPRTSIGMPHSLVYNFAMGASQDICNNTTPEICLIIGRPLYMLEDWLKANIEAFQTGNRSSAETEALKHHIKQQPLRRNRPSPTRPAATVKHTNKNL